MGRRRLFYIEESGRSKSVLIAKLFFDANEEREIREAIKAMGFSEDEVNVA